jgi:hypothetical protein
MARPASAGQEGKIITKAVEYWDLIPLMLKISIVEQV